MGTFDHHCPAIGNCVGEGNQRTFAAWLGLLLTAQLLFLHLSCAYCARVARHRWATAGIHDRAGWGAVGPGLWLLFGMHPGKMLLILVEASSPAVSVCLCVCVCVYEMYQYLAHCACRVCVLFPVQTVDPFFTGQTLDPFSRCTQRTRCIGYCMSYTVM